MRLWEEGGRQQQGRNGAGNGVREGKDGRKNGEGRSGGIKLAVLGYYQTDSAACWLRG